MDFTLGSATGAGNGSSRSPSFSDRPISSITTDLQDNTTPNTTSGAPTPTMLSPTSSSGKHGRELDLDEAKGAPLKLARTDSSPTRQLGTMPIRTNGQLRLPCSPNESCASGEALLNAGLDSNLGAESRMLYSPLYLAAHQPQPPIPPAPPRHYSYQIDPFQYKPGTLPLSRESSVMNSGYLGLHESFFGGGYPFTAAQWAELEHQALIFKYMMARVSIPPELILPIRKSVAALTGSLIQHGGWGGFGLGMPTGGGAPEIDPARCRRTDGKKWRCNRPVVPDQKYCERHMHRGRHRGKKATEGQQPSQKGSNNNVQEKQAGDNSVQEHHQSQPQQSQQPQQPQAQQNQHQHQPEPVKKTTPMSSPGQNQPVMPSMTSSIQIPVHNVGSLQRDRVLNGISKAPFDMRPEQLLFSETSGSARGTLGLQHQHHQQTGDLSRVSLLNPNHYQNQQQQQQQASPAANLFPAYMRMQQQGQDLGFMADGNRLNFLMAQQQQQQQQQHQQHQQQHQQQQHKQNSMLTSQGVALEGLRGEHKRTDDQPLRHFFDDWPRSRESSALSWMNMEGKQVHNGSPTQLSISIPSTNSDIGSMNGGRSKLLLSPLKLSMSRAGEEGSESTNMWLSAGLSSQHPNSHHHQQSTNWFPISTSEAAVGGPLAEVLQSSSSQQIVSNNVGLNLLGDAWENTSLQGMRKPTTGAGGCVSDSSSSTSSPGSVKTEPAMCETFRKPVLLNGSRSLIT